MNEQAQDAVPDAILRMTERLKPRSRQAAARRLMTLFPERFPVDDALVRPFVVGMHGQLTEALREIAPEITVSHVKSALAWWCNRTAYHYMISHGKWRRDLQGNKICRIELAERKWAKDCLTGRAHRKPADKAGGTDNPDHHANRADPI